MRDLKESPADLGHDAAQKLEDNWADTIPTRSEKRSQKLLAERIDGEVE